MSSSLSTIHSESAAASALGLSAWRICTSKRSVEYCEVGCGIHLITARFAPRTVVPRAVGALGSTSILSPYTRRATRTLSRLKRASAQKIGPRPDMRFIHRSCFVKSSPAPSR